MKMDIRRLPSPREYELLDFDGKRQVVELAQTILFVYLATERPKDV